jgi:1-aminocyclopropane-1-carboxylate deaminase
MPSPVQEIKEDLFSEKEVRVFVKREDLNHPVISGNKWRKLKDLVIKRF